VTASPTFFLRASAGRRALIFIVAPLALALACGSNEDEQPPAPPGPVAIALGKFFPRGSDSWKPGDSEPVVLGCDGQLGVTAWVYAPGTLPDPEAMVEIDPDTMRPKVPAHIPGDWLFRPPGACSRDQCGTLAVSVESVDGGAVATGEAALDTVVVNLSPLGSAFQGRLRVRAELRENGATLAVYRGEPLAYELEIDVVPDDCPPDGEGGAGGAPSTGGTGGSGGTGNQGGEAGVPGAAGSPGGAGGAASGTAGEGGAGGV